MAANSFFRNSQVPESECHHLEADTIIFFIYAQLRKMGRQETVVIDAEDTDVVVLSARVSHEIQGLLGIRRKKEVFDCHHLCSAEMSKIIVQLHCKHRSRCSQWILWTRKDVCGEEWH